MNSGETKAMRNQGFMFGEWKDIPDVHISTEFKDKLVHTCKN